MRKRFVVLDRDGTVIVEKHYLSDHKLVALLPGAAAGLKALNDAGFGLIIVTNQSGLGRGYFSRDQLDQVNKKMLDMLAEYGVAIDGIFYCPHTPDDNCGCRKPLPGLILDAGQKLSFEPEKSYVIGDKPCDILLGQNVKATTLLVRTGYGAQYEKEQSVSPDFIVDDLQAAAHIILAAQIPAAE